MDSVVALYYEGELVCLGCAHDRGLDNYCCVDSEPVFASQEFDFQPVCEDCGCDIEVSVIEDEDCDE